jgi:transposase InsO family protein
MDSGATANFVDQRWVKKCGLQNAGSPRQVEAIDGHRVLSYGNHQLKIQARDKKREVRTQLQAFEAVDLDGYDAILGWTWLYEVNPKVNWHKRTWKYRKLKSYDPEIVMTARAFEDALMDAEKRAADDPASREFLSRIYAVTVYQKGSSTTLTLKGAQVEEIKLPKDYKDFEDVFSEAQTGAVTVYQKGSSTTLTLNGAQVEEIKLPKDYKDFEDVFSEAQAGVLAPHRDHDHAIELEAGKRPPQRPLYSLSIKEMEVLREYVQKALEKGWIRPSKSPAGAPVLFVPKKDGGYRLCVDYRGLNAITVKNAYPIANMEQAINRLSGAKIYTQLDLRDAYHRIRIKCGDEWKTAFKTHYGHFEYQVMPFGLANAPATFQSYIDRALADLKDVICVAYLDDIVIFSQNEKDHKEHVRTVLERLRTYKLYAKVSKCAFNTKEIKFLGFIISTDGVRMEPERIKTIMEWPVPRSVKEIMAFLGFANFYRRFIKNYSAIAAPLSDMTRKDIVTKFPIEGEALQAFHRLQQAFVQEPLLRHFNPALPTRLQTDASGYAIAGIISQLSDDTEWHPIAYWSRKLDKAERNYETHDAELLAIVECFRIWRHFLEGNPQPITVLSDHANLKWFMTTKSLTKRQARWAEKLAEFDFHIEHCPGKQNPADAPSRRADYLEREEGDVVTGTVLRKLQEQLDNQAPRRTESRVEICAILRKAASEKPDYSHYTKELSASVTELLRIAQECDPKTQEWLQRLKKPTAEHPMREWTLEDQLLRFEGRIFVPESSALRAEILKLNHDDPSGGHQRVERTQELIKSKYYWHNMNAHIKEYVEGCHTCQSIAVHRHRPYGHLEPLPAAQAPAEWITIDFITGLPPAEHYGDVYDAVLVVVDRFTKFAWYIACKKTTSAEELAMLLITHVYAVIGTPKNIVSDRGSVFTSEFWSNLCWFLGVRRKMSTAYHPQTDGQTERQNQVLEYFLRAYVNWNQDDWPRWLPIAQLVNNQAKKRSTGLSPAEVMLNFKPSFRIEPEPPKGGMSNDAAAMARRMEEVRRDVSKRLEKAREVMKAQYDKRRSNMTFKVGQSVMLRTKHITSARPNRKLSETYLGPFTIIDAWGKQSYKLELPPHMRRVHSTFHVSMLEPYKGDASKAPQPGPMLVNGEPQYMIEKILDEVPGKEGPHYMVKWVGWDDPKDLTEEPFENVKDTEALDLFLKSRKKETRSRKNARK